MYFEACILIMNENSEILSVSRKSGEDFGLPSSKVEPGETPIQAAMRGLLEETGYKIDDWRLVTIIYHAETDGKLTVAYEAPFDALKQLPLKPTEAAEVRWLKPHLLAECKNFNEYNCGLFKACGIMIKNEKKKYPWDSSWQPKAG